MKDTEDSETDLDGEGCFERMMKDRFCMCSSQTWLHIGMLWGAC